MPQLVYASDDSDDEDEELHDLAAEHGNVFDRAAATRLVERVGTSLARLDAELAKLAIAIEGDPPAITEELVDRLVPPSREEQGSQPPPRYGTVLRRRTADCVPAVAAALTSLAVPPMP